MTDRDVLELIYSALRRYKSDRVNDVTAEEGEDHDEIVLTTDDGKRLQTWVIYSDGIVETDSPEK